MEEFEFVYHENNWHWGDTVDIIKKDGNAIVCVKFDKKNSPKSAYICGLSVVEQERNKGCGKAIMLRALDVCKKRCMLWAVLCVDESKIWLKEWYERLGFKEYSKDDKDITMIKGL